MELRHLRAFVIIADEMNLHRAAERLHISQPPLTRLLQQLEEELGVALFDRAKQRLRLTEAGAAFRDEARLVLAQSDRAVRAAQRAARGETGRLAIGFIESATATGLLPLALARFRRAHPTVELCLSEMPSLRQADALRARTIDVGFIYSRPADPAGLAFQTLLQGEQVLVMARAHPLARTRPLTLAAVAAEPLILWEREMNPARYDAILAAIRKGGAEPRVAQHAVQNQTIVGLAAAGLGIGVVPGSYAVRKVGGVVYRKMPGARLPVDMDLMWRRGDTSPALAAFVEIAGAVGKDRALARASNATRWAVATG